MVHTKTFYLSPLDIFTLCGILLIRHAFCLVDHSFTLYFRRLLMFNRFFVLLLVVFFIVTLFGCGAEEEEILLGEEVVVEKWIDPTDTGKEYLIENEDP